jgi:ferredoxin
MLKVEVDSSVCQGHGRCYDIAPDLFCADDLGYASVVSDNVPDELAEHARRAERSCPERAITVTGP